MGVDENSSPAQAAVFRTEFGFPLLPAVILELMSILALASHVADGWMLAFHQVTVVVVPVAVLYFMATTKYRVEAEVLELRAGPFRRRIPIDAITAVSEYGVKRGRTYGLGTDIIAVRYEGGEVGITPKDPVGLAEALDIRLTRLGDGQAPA